MGKLYERACNQCGQWYKGGGAQFCSRSCRTIWSNLRDNPAKRDSAREKISAARVGKPTTLGREMPQSQRKNVGNARRGKKASPEWRANIGAGLKVAGVKPPRNPHLVGPAHPNWKGGHRTARSADFSSPLYKEFRRTVASRDNWTCRGCGTTKCRLEVHHIETWCEAPEKRYDLNNGILLCRPCHKAMHRGIPRPKGGGPRTLAELRLGRVVA
jgi:HNH endonuclease